MYQYNNLSKIVQTGDWIFLTGGSAWYSKWIRKFTFSKANHVAIVYDETRIFETDLQYGAATFHLLKALQDKKIAIVRPKFYKPDDYIKVRNLCRTYEGRPYSVWDVTTNAVFFWLKSELRAKLISALSNTFFMKCDELVARITWEVTKHKTIKAWEGYTPGRLLEIAYFNPADYEIVLNTL